MRRMIEAAMLSLALILTQAENARALSPQLERSRQLFEALQHLNQIAHMLSEPIDKIEYGSKGDIRFTGGTCTVAVIIHEKLLTLKEIENGDPAGYTSEVGPVLCQP